MAGVADFQLGSVYTFGTFVPAVLGTFENVKIEGVVGAADVYNYIDPAVYHANVYGGLPPGSCEDDFSKYYYVVVLHPNGLKNAVGLPWIDASSIVLKTRNTGRVIIDDIGPEDIPLIKEALSANGYNAVEITVS